MKLKIIKSNTQINNLFQKGTKVGSPIFVFFYLPASQEDQGFAVIAPKKVFKLAVDRNFVKRRLRELCRKHVKPGVQLVVLARSGCKTVVFKDLEEQFSKCIAGI